MSNFKVSLGKESKKVVFNDNLENLDKFQDIIDRIFKHTQNKAFILNKQNLVKNENYKLTFIEEKCSFIPIEVKDGLFDEESFTFFKSKVMAHGKDIKYKLYIEKVNELPKFHKKDNEEILENNLKKYWDITLNDITSELNLRKLEASKGTFEKLKEEQRKKEEILKNVKHKNIICSNCFEKDFNGKRFICSECNNYNLCQKCENILNEKEIHQREHVLIQINKNLNDDFLKYNNVIGNYRKEFQNVDDTFELEFTVINNGENDLQNCFILPIRYGEEYLTCDAKKITDSIKKGKSAKINLDIKILKKIGYLEGYFRMLTPAGLPFGSIIYIKVINEN